MAENNPLVLVCSVRLECAQLLEGLEARREAPAGGKPAWRGRLEGREVRLVQGGMGKVNAAHALTAVLEHAPAAGVVGFGVAGAYPDSGLEIGDVAIASTAIYADEGVEGPDGWMGTDGIGIPLAERDGQRWFNLFRADREVVQAASTRLDTAGIRHRVGPFLTVSCCSGTTRRGVALAARWEALCEGMEGAALAHVATLYGLPWVELRAVSNRVEDRDLTGWRLTEAAAAVQRAVRAVVGGWPVS